MAAACGFGPGLQQQTAIEPASLLAPAACPFSDWSNIISNIWLNRSRIGTRPESALAAGTLFKRTDNTVDSPPHARNAPEPLDDDTTERCAN